MSASVRRRRVDRAPATFEVAVPFERVPSKRRVRPEVFRSVGRGAVGRGGVERVADADVRDALGEPVTDLHRPAAQPVRLEDGREALERLRPNALRRAQRVAHRRE